ncbi:MAG: hypothetical protein ABEJ81_05310 [Haloferacaceae archaeon]
MATDAATLCERARDATDRLEQVRAERERAREAVRERGTERTGAVASAYHEATRLLDRYEESATGTGNFEAYVEFQERFAELVEGLDEDLPLRDAFEEAAEAIDRRRLRGRDFAAARSALDPAAELVDLLDRRDEADERFRQVRHEADEALDAVEERIADLERVEELGDADLDAPVERLREPIEEYDDAVREAFAEYKRTASARALFSLLTTADRYPLVDFRRPPRDLREYVETYPAGAEPIPKLLEYADYSASKLDHYVEDPGALRARVATHRTYLERLDAEPLTVAWPPPADDVLGMRGEELVALVGRFADESTVALARRIRHLPRRTDYDRLREAARARTELTDDQRERLRTGRVGDDLDRLRAAREEVRAVLEGD